MGQRNVHPLGWVCRSPVVHAANKMRAAHLGALALTPLPRYRHQFFLRAMFGGLFELRADTSTSMSFGEQHTPPMADDIVVGASDHNWLSLLGA